MAQVAKRLLVRSEPIAGTLAKSKFFVGTEGYATHGKYTILYFETSQMLLLTIFGGKIIFFSLP